jgi:hypothetical protein
MKFRHTVALALILALLVAAGCASQQAQGVSDQTPQAKVDADADKQIYWQEHRFQFFLVAVPLLPVLVLMLPFSPKDKCEYDASGHTILYDAKKEPMPTRCAAFAEQQRAVADLRRVDADSKVSEKCARIRTICDRARGLRARL